VCGQMIEVVFLEKPAEEGGTKTKKSVPVNVCIMESPKTPWSRATKRTQNLTPTQPEGGWDRFRPKEVLEGRNRSKGGEITGVVESLEHTQTKGGQSKEKKKRTRNNMRGNCPPCGREGQTPAGREKTGKTHRCGSPWLGGRDQGG